MKCSKIILPTGGSWMSFEQLCMMIIWKKSLKLIFLHYSLSGFCFAFNWQKFPVVCRHTAGLPADLHQRSRLSDSFFFLLTLASVILCMQLQCFPELHLTCHTWPGLVTSHSALLPNRLPRYFPVPNGARTAGLGGQKSLSRHFFLIIFWVVNLSQSGLSRTPFLGSSGCLSLIM